jgi:magnesium-transporting ATPase (P-type)
VKDSAPRRVAALREEGVRVVMLTGDNRTHGGSGARRIGGIDEVEADVLPEQKQRSSELKAEGRRSWRWPATGSTMRRAGGGRCRHRHGHRHRRRHGKRRR